MWCAVHAIDSNQVRVWVGNSAGVVCELLSVGNSLKVVRSAVVSKYCLADGCLAADGKSLWVCATNGSLIQLCTQSLSCLREIRPTKGALLSLSCVDGFVAAAGDDGAVVHIRAQAGRETMDFDVTVSHFASITSVLLLPGSTGSGLLLLLLLSKDGTVSVWDVDPSEHAGAHVRDVSFAVLNPTSMDAVYHEGDDKWTVCVVGGTGTCTFEVDMDD
jgi:WD40 repeat protein